LCVPFCAVAAGTLALGESPSALRLAAWALTVTAYFMFWTCLAVSISALSRSSFQSAGILIGAYLTIVLIIPTTSGVVARSLYPLPSRAAIAERERQARFEALGPISGAQQQLYAAARARFPYTVGDAEAQARSTRAIWETVAEPPRGAIADAYFARYGDLSTPAYTFQLRQILHRARGEYIEQQMAPLLAEFDGRRERQRAVVRGAAWLSPALATALALDELAGTSGARRERFLAQLDAYVRAWYDVIYRLIRRNRSVTPALMSAQKPFVFSEEPDTAVVGRVTPLLVGLFGAAVCVVVFAGRRVSRMVPAG
jgi:hypothetical protein